MTKQPSYRTGMGAFRGINNSTFKVSPSRNRVNLMADSADNFGGVAKFHDSFMSLGYQSGANFASNTQSQFDDYFGGNKFHSSKANWHPHNSIVKDTNGSLMRASKKRIVDSQEYLIDE